MAEVGRHPKERPVLFGVNENVRRSSPPTRNFRTRAATGSLAEIDRGGTQYRRSIGVLYADLPGIALTNIDPYRVALLFKIHMIEFRDRAYLVANCTRLNKVA